MKHQKAQLAEMKHHMEQEGRECGEYTLWGSELFPTLRANQAEGSDPEWISTLD